MEEHMNFNYIDSNRDNYVDASEYEFYLEQIGISDMIQDDDEGEEVEEEDQAVAMVSVNHRPTA